MKYYALLIAAVIGLLLATWVGYRALYHKPQVRPDPEEYFKALTTPDGGFVAPKERLGPLATFDGGWVESDVPSHIGLKVHGYISAQPFRRKITWVLEVRLTEDPNSPPIIRKVYRDASFVVEPNTHQMRPFMANYPIKPGKYFVGAWFITEVDPMPAHPETVPPELSFKTYTWMIVK